MIRTYRQQYTCTAAFMVHNTYIPIVLYVQVQYVYIYSNQRTDQSGKVAKPARGQLNREDEYFPGLFISPYAIEPVPSLSGHATCMPMTFTAEIPSEQGQ